MHIDLAEQVPAVHLLELDLLEGGGEVLPLRLLDDGAGYRLATRGLHHLQHHHAGAFYNSMRIRIQGLK